MPYIQKAKQLYLFLIYVSSKNYCYYLTYTNGLFNGLGSRWAESFEEAVKSPFDSEQDEGMADSSINVEANDIDLQFEGQNVQKDSEQKQSSASDSALTADNEYYQLMFNLYLITIYQATNIAEAYMT